MIVALIARPMKIDKTLTPVGLLCRYYLGCTPKHPLFSRGADFVLKSPPQRSEVDIYCLYFITNGFHPDGGLANDKDWAPKIR